MRYWLIALPAAAVVGCTFIVGSHNTSDRQGPCGAVIWSKCDDSGATDVIQDKPKTSTEGEKRTDTKLVGTDKTTKQETPQP